MLLSSVLSWTSSFLPHFLHQHKKVEYFISIAVHVIIIEVKGEDARLSGQITQHTNLQVHDLNLCLKTFTNYNVMGQPVAYIQLKLCMLSP